MTDFFSPDYLTARARFRAGVLAIGGQIESILLNAKCPGGEDLTIDTGWFGSPEPKRAFIHSSGLHGVDGFAGSAIQLQWLEDGMPEIAQDCAIAIVHVINPFGMAWLRRVNENNADLNRNFLAADEQYEGAPERYAELNPFLNPASPPTRDLFLLRALGRGIPRTVDEGQYDFPLGLSFGGRRHEQGARRFQLYLSDRLAHAEHIVAIDVTTGPGPAGPGKGSLEGLYNRMFPAARVCFSVQRFGTCNQLVALSVLRRENRQHHHGDGGVRNPAKAKLLEAYCPSSRKWRGQVLKQGREFIASALSQLMSGTQPDPPQA